MKNLDLTPAQRRALNLTICPDCQKILRQRDRERQQLSRRKAMKNVVVTCLTLLVTALAACSSDPDPQDEAATTTQELTSNMYWCELDSANHYTGRCFKSPGTFDRSCSAVVADTDCPANQAGTYMNTTYCFNADRSTTSIRISNRRCY